MKLLNVRLGPEDARKAARLREAARAARRSASEIMADIYREYPDRPNRPRGERDLSDRVKVRRLIRQRLRPRRS
jgi:hypothetical protein